MRFYVSGEREHEYGYVRVVDQTHQDTSPYPGASLYGQEHVVCMCERVADAARVCALLNAGAES